jgi:hypothetical protein
MMETIMFGAQTVKHFQSNDQKDPDDMKGNPKTGVKRKKHKSVKFQIEEDKVLEAYVTHWQGWKRMTEFSNGRSKGSRTTIFDKELEIQVTTT